MKNFCKVKIGSSKSYDGAVAIMFDQDEGDRVSIEACINTWIVYRWERRNADDFPRDEPEDAMDVSLNDHAFSGAISAGDY